MKKLFVWFKNHSSNRGIAMLIVLVMIAIMLPIAFDMNSNAKLEYELAMQYKKKAEARSLAESGANFAVVVFDLQKQLETSLKQFFGDGAASFEIWDIVPFDTAVLREFTAAGPFADITDIYEQDEVDEAGSAKDGEEKENNLQKEDDGDPFFEFPGDFRLAFANEDGKININMLDSSMSDSIVSILQSMISDELYDFVFVEGSDRVDFVSREELIANIKDWIDMAGGDSPLYDDFFPSYKLKNARLDTLDELYMVYGVNNVVYKILNPYVTIYSTGKINIAKAEYQMLEAIIRAYAEDKSLSIFSNDDAMRELMGKVLAERAKTSFAKVDDFISVVTAEGITLNSNVKNILEVKGSIYKIVSTGEKDGVESTVEMVVDREGNLYYYREQ